MDALPPGVSLSEIPLAPNPSGDPPNFVDPPSLIVAVQAVGITLGFTALVLLVTRMVMSRQLKRPFGLDDASVIAAWVLAAGYTGASCSLGGVTRHAWDTPLSFLDEAYLKKLFATSLIYGPMLFFSKTCILIFYYRTFQRKVWLRMCIYTILAIMIGTYWMTVPLCFYYCMPHPNTGQAWDLTILANCNHLANPGLVQAGMNIAVDIAIFVLPLPIVFKLQIPLGKKLSIAGIFTTGFFALVASALTLYYRIRIINGYDVSWAGAQTYICIQVEAYTSIIVACMPSLAKVWTSAFKDMKLLTSLQSLLSRSKGGSSYNKSAGSYGMESESTSHLQRKGYSEIYASQDVEARPHEGPGIHRSVTVEMRSVQARNAPRTPGH
ncbi:Rhodopsin domain-containing protein [Madurella fahalii]|uniref:Rhodopsin domain-containing protein n=1 Tax=Madurella fahalii TaxID=1157608 RepID=A0ABQ0GC00_9PEZI